MRWKSTIVCLIAVPAAILMLGYWLRPAPETVVVLSPEQVAIQHYSEGAKNAAISLNDFVNAWNETSALSDPEEKRVAMESRVLIALREYVKALEELPTDTPDLTRIHGILISAYRDALRGFEQYVEESKRDDSLAHLDGLIQSLTRLKAQEREYREALLHYYESHQVTPAETAEQILLTPPASRWEAPQSPVESALAHHLRTPKEVKVSCSI